MSEENERLQEFVKFQITRRLTYVAKTSLHLLEEIKENNQDFDFQKYRKKMLDVLGDSVRELDELLSKVNFTLK